MMILNRRMGVAAGSSLRACFFGPFNDGDVVRSLTAYVRCDSTLAAPDVAPCQLSFGVFQVPQPVDCTQAQFQAAGVMAVAQEGAILTPTPAIMELSANILDNNIGGPQHRFPLQIQFGRGYRYLGVQIQNMDGDDNANVMLSVDAVPHSTKGWEV